MEAFRPGSALYSGGLCTAGFFLRNELNDTIYILTAGHCYARGIQVRDKGDRIVGEVVAVHHDGLLDYALIAATASYRETLSPSLTHWTGPTIPPRHTIRTHDPICFYGHGNGFDYADQTRARCGEFWSNQNESHGGRAIGVWRSEFQANTGDSGGPVIDYTTGAAIGILLGGTPGSIAGGIDICSILSSAKDLDGLELRLAQAPYKQAAMTYPPPPLPVLYGDETPMTVPCGGPVGP